MTTQLIRSADFSKLPCDILISTPLRLRLAIRKKKINLRRCVMLISCLCILILALQTSISRKQNRLKCFQLILVSCRVEYLVLDESDKLFDLGLLKQIDSVVKACSNPSIIRSLFSATLPDSVEELARTIMHDAVRVIIGRK